MTSTASTAIWARAIADAEKDFVQLAKIDGDLVNYQREAGFAMQAIQSSEHLQKCHPDSIRNAVINVANIGLTLNRAMKLAYLVPRDGLCCLDISYIGLVKIATDSGSVLAVAAVPVRVNDTFKWNGPFVMPDHIFDVFAPEDERGDIRGVYTVAKLASGITQIDPMRREEIDYIRSLSKAKRDDAPWNRWFEEMVKKSGIKRASKLWPRTERLSKAEAILNEHEGLERPAIDAEVMTRTVEQPPSKTEAEQSPAAPANPQGSATAAGSGAGGSGAASVKTTAADVVLSDGAKQTLRNALKRAGKSELDLDSAGFGKIDEMRFSKFNDAMAWAKKPAATATA